MPEATRPATPAQLLRVARASAAAADLALAGAYEAAADLWPHLGDEGLALKSALEAARRKCARACSVLIQAGETIEVDKAKA